MKTLLIFLAVLCTIACSVQAQNFPGLPGPKLPEPRQGFPGGPSGPWGPSMPTFPNPRPWGPSFPGPQMPTFPSPNPRPWGPTLPGPRVPQPTFQHRLRRETPQDHGSITVQGRQPLSGPDRKPSLDINYNHHIINDDRTKLDAFGGGNLRDGHLTPQAGFGLEHKFKNDIFIRGQGQVQPGPRGGLSPSFGVGMGWRFRREALPYEEEEVMEEVY